MQQQLVLFLAVYKDIIKICTYKVEICQEIGSWKKPALKGHSTQNESGV